MQGVNMLIIQGLGKCIYSAIFIDLNDSMLGMKNVMNMIIGIFVLNIEWYKYINIVDQYIQGFRYRWVQHLLRNKSSLWLPKLFLSFYPRLIDLSNRIKKCGKPQTKIWFLCYEVNHSTSYLMHFNATFLFKNVHKDSSLF